MSQHILVTGTNSGFGRLTALTLANAGHRVFATMRDIAGRNAAVRADLEKAGNGNLEVVEMALGDDASVENAVKSVLEKVGHLDVVVNNAGYSVLGLEETLTSAQLAEQYNINVVGPHRVMRAALPSMRARGKGLIVQVSSGLGRYVFPVMGAYSSSKAALEALSDAYRYELKPVGIDVCIIQPGAYPTDIGKNSVVGGEQDRAAGYGPMAGALGMMQQNLANMFAGRTPPNPQDIADAVLKLVQADPGTRPGRVVVDTASGAMAETLNKAHTEIQNALLNAFGMGMLADK